MKKSNWLILGIAAVACAFLLWLWYYLGFNKIDDPLDLVLAIIWWVIVVLAGALIAKAEKARRERIRTIYVMGGKLFNSEAGEVSPEEGSTLAQAAQKLLEQLDYGFDRNELPDGAKPGYVIQSEEFKAGDEPTWKGKVTKVVPGGDNVETEFDGIDQLTAALA